MPTLFILKAFSPGLHNGKIKDIPSVRVFVMITWKSSTTPTNELDSNALELKYWVCGKDSLMGAGIFMK